MPGGLDAWHADCWEFARLQRAPVIAAARRRTGAVNDLSAYLLALRRDPDLPRLSLDGLAPVGSAILDRPEPCRVAHANSPCSSVQSASRAEGNDGEQGDSKHQAKHAERLPEPGRLGDGAAIPPRGDRGAVRSVGDVERQSDARRRRDQANDQVLNPVGHSGDRKPDRDVARRDGIARLERAILDRLQPSQVAADNERFPDHLAFSQPLAVNPSRRVHRFGDEWRDAAVI